MPDWRGDSYEDVYGPDPSNRMNPPGMPSPWSPTSPDTWGFDPGTDYGGHDPFDIAFSRSIRGGGRAGVFDPLGSSGLRELLRARTMGDAASRRRGLLMRARGNATVDPSTYGTWALRGDLEGGRATADALTQGDIGTSMEAQRWLRDLAMQQYQYRQNQHNTMRDFYLSNEASHRGKGTFGDFLGGIAGNVAGGFLPWGQNQGAGGGWGGGWGGGGGDMPRMGDPDFQYPWIR